MKKNHLIVVALVLLACSATFAVFSLQPGKSSERKMESRLELSPEKQIDAVVDPIPKEEKHCVFKTVFGDKPVDSLFVCAIPMNVGKSIEESLAWLATAQQKNGGWGGGTHAYQENMDPLATPSDPASTAMVGLALLRCGNTPNEGKYHTHLNKAAAYLLMMVEESPKETANITSQTGTQPQVKLGANIDVVMTSQFLTNLVAHYSDESAMKPRIKKCIEKCVYKIERNTGHNGSSDGGSWAGVLQSSFAVNALQSAEDAGVDVQDSVLNRAEQYQLDAVDVQKNEFRTDDAAGIVLYSVTSSARSSAFDARDAKLAIKAAKKEGKLKEQDEVTKDNLVKSGYSETEALRLSSAFAVNEMATGKAMQSDVISGFGNNGGEEFLSFLQTGEGMIMSHSTEWKNWYFDTCNRLMQIQNKDGSWNGHHCITSPVFCTATCLLILGVANDANDLAYSGVVTKTGE
ncbi:MAG: prenyltransferase/squalene oxidase repeat-containing protein [Flavobacteriales bacterium]|nr:prenyltransferase/squalene oxidase repeat-containing protein [Flavobacteriales bacterium]